MLRYLDSDSATIWVETDAACTVGVQAAGAPPAKAETFNVCGHHYAIVAVRGLSPGVAAPYTVTLDATTVWPLEGSRWPKSLLRPYASGAPLRIAFGSCRAAGPLDDMQWGVDALHALAERMRTSPRDSWPDLLALVGDQVYADDNLSPETKRYIASHRGPDEGAGHEVANVDEYTYLYAESWSPEPIRWLFSTLPSAMIFDDHDIRDDWNTSEPWRRQMQATDWWQERITSGLLTYWLYQHLGNLSPADLETDPVLAELAAIDGDGEKVLRAHAEQADAAAEGGPAVQWSYRRDFGKIRLVVLDSRANRVVDGRQRLMVSDQEWAWFDAQCTGDLDQVDHLLIVTSLPLMLPPAVHGLEALDEALAEGRWGRRAARLGEKLRQGVDLEHWAAFETSLQRMLRLLTEVESGQRGKPPATITFLSGDVHFSYLAEAHRDGQPAGSRVLQAVCSPLRNPLGRNIAVMERLASSRIGLAIGQFLTRRAHASTLGWGWDITRGPVFGNTLGELTVQGRSLEVRMSSAKPGPSLVQVWDADFGSAAVA